MLSDVEISQSAQLQHINEIASKLDIEHSDLECYGHYKAKLSPSVWDKVQDNQSGKLILVTAINPTPAGEGKTTTSIGLGEALSFLGHKTCIALREPSLGPCFGLKGGATGGGYSQVLPMEDINLHFTGDIHAITTAHNLLAAIVDNHIHQGNQLDFNIKRISWRRVVDLNDRALRNVIIGLGKPTDGVTRESGFDITVSSEIMAILCLSHDLHDLKTRVGNIIVGYNKQGEPITCDMLQATGALTVLLKDAIKPNIVQTIGGTPALIHGGPFANIAHGCSSLIATKYALKLAEYTVTEAGFGADLGAEKFLDIKCRLLGQYPSAVVIVATVKALKMHGNVPLNELHTENLSALSIGFKNLEKHIQNMQRYNVPIVVALNVFTSDTENELNLVKQMCASLNVPVEYSRVWEFGGKGGIELAKRVIELSSTNTSFKPLYNLEDSTANKIETIAKTIYGATNVAYTSKALTALQTLDNEKLPICIAKIPGSLSDNKSLLGRPENFTITINDLKLMNGAGFIVAYSGDIMTMPGLPKRPNAEKIDISDDFKVIGLS